MMPVFCSQDYIILVSLTPIVVWLVASFISHCANILALYMQRRREILYSINAELRIQNNVFI